MLDLPYPHKHRTSGKRQIRVYLIPCPKCNVARWIRSSHRLGGCRKCNQPTYTNEWIGRQYTKYQCIYKNCTRETTGILSPCRLHKRLVIDRYKTEARWAVNNAIADGRLIRLPCTTCGSLKSQAHHPDYRNKLDVLWLCRECHQQEHGGRFV